ncbi:MAG: DUF1566 domain-containing protein [Magnetococcales bacterium]|nr:DUF1566 domain-containing protein [Magnetococcales bacterium]
MTRYLTILLLLLLCTPLQANPSEESQRFIVHGNGTVTDRQSGLLVLQNGNCFGMMSWEAAQEAVAKLAEGSCGLQDGSQAGAWRLPERQELLLLLDWQRQGPFVGVEQKNYWSASSVDSAPASAWLVLLSNGYIGYHQKSNAAGLLWPVRKVP